MNVLDNLISVFDFVARIIQLYLLQMLSNWYTTILIFLMVLGGIVSAYVAIRGFK